MSDHIKSTNIQWHAGQLDHATRAQALGLSGATLWFTGLSGSGKSTVAVALEQLLIHQGTPAYRLDGDNIRHGLNADLGFSPKERQENIRRIAEVSKLFTDAGLLTLVSFISPYQKDRDAVRALHSDAGLPFVEIFVDTPLATCEERDPKGLYQKARSGELTEFTGISAPYEAPKNPELVLDTRDRSPNECALQCLHYLQKNALYAPQKER